MPVSDLFESRLAAKLEEAGPRLAAWQDTILTSPFEPARPHVVSMPDLRAGAHVYARVQPTTDPGRDVAGRRPTNPLTLAQRDALTALRRLGAALSDEFTARQLKAAFRRLALQLHPDRHPDADPDRRRSLGTRFAVLCEAYRILSAPSPRPGLA